MKRPAFILIDGFLAPWFLMLGAPGFHLYPGYLSCLGVTAAAGALLGSILWGLPGYLRDKP